MAILQAVTGATQEVDLPLLWHAIANAPKHLEHAKSQVIFEATAQQLGFGTYTPVIMVVLVQSLETPCFCTKAPTVLTEGFQLFNLVSPGFSTQLLESSTSAANYDHLVTGRNSIHQYLDIQAIQGHQNLVLPTSMSGVGVHIHTAYIMLATMLGIHHPLLASPASMNMRALLEDEWGWEQRWS